MIVWPPIHGVSDRQIQGNVCTPYYHPMHPSITITFLCLGLHLLAQRPVPSPYDRHVGHPLASGAERGAPPANDDCANAAPIELLADCSGAVDGSNAGSAMDGSVPSCDDPGSTEPDVWYTFTTGAADTVIITLTPQAGMTDWAYVLLEGSCAGNEVACRIQPAIPMTEHLLPSTTYFLRVFSNPVYGTAGDFTLCLQDLDLVDVPANDLCANAPLQALPMGGTITFTGNSTNAQNTEDLPLVSVWHAFTLSEPADVTIDLCGSAAFFPYFFRALYFTCPPDQAQRRYAGYENITDCAGNRPTLCYPALPAGTYYYAVTNGNAPGTYTLHVKADPVGSHQPVNDDCAGAIAVPVSATCTPTPCSPTCASGSDIPPGDCADGLGDTSDDVWYSFSATQATMTIAVFPNSDQFGAVIQLFSGACGTLTSVACANGFDGDVVQLPLNDLVPGNTYFVRVYNGYYTTPLDDPGYSLCVAEGFGITIGIEEQHSVPDAMEVRPNPSNGSFTLATGAPGSLIPLELCDAAGRMVLHASVRTDAAGNATVEVALSPGSYTVRVNDGKDVRIARVVIQ